MISIFQALEIIKHETFLLETETVDLKKSINRILGEEIRADMDLPPFNRSQMDGFAVRAKDIETASGKNSAKLKIIGESVAGKGFDGKIGKGEAVRIMTGARVPDGADAVQKKEAAREFQDANAERFVEIFEGVKLQQNIVRKGAEIKMSEGVFEGGEVINERMIASLASFGYAKVRVYKKPRVAILATGSEIVGIDEMPVRDQIRNSNSIMLRGFAEKFGADVEILPLVKDDLSNLKSQIAKAVGLDSEFQIPNSKLKTRHRLANKNKDKSGIWNSESEILIISGGVSVGDYDFTKPALRELGAEIFFEKVSLKPGKPTVFAKLNDRLVFGLPGNPVSVAVTFYLFVRAALLKMQGANDCDLRKGFAIAATEIKGAKERDSFLPVFVEANREGKLVIESLRFGGSSNFVAFSSANSLAFVPQGKSYKRDDVVEIVYLTD